MSMLVRAARPAMRPLARTMQRRGVHIENEVHNNMPFSYRNKGAFAAKLITFCTLGFSIPFIASAYQLSKQ
ncbi:hypothetical protein DL93DRAFT_2088280 [Clavulina sp. PMI_390]|nr:hypothetical protein DL93DRAFT_2088280 [Clavulina sp. PMI_390]